MHRHKYTWTGLYSGILIILMSCTNNADSVGPINTGDSIPKPVKNVSVKNLPGAAQITYDVPNSKSLLYVKAVFKIEEENIREEKVSYYKNSILVKGFPDTNTYVGKIYAVSRGERQSEPVEVEIKPQKPPIKGVSETVKVKSTFGGVSISFQNISEENIVLNVLATDSLGEMTSVAKFYTQKNEGVFAARGFSPEERQFGVVVRDRWYNYSDTTLAKLTPLSEEKLDKSNFQEVQLPTDSYTQHCCGGGMTDLWDGVWNDGANTLHTKPSAGIPQWFTFDLGSKIKLSRFKLYARNGNYTYSAGDPKKFEIWGSNNPAKDGSWSNWTKFGTFEDETPSGEQTPTAEDLDYAVLAGKDFAFSNAASLPAVRYIRFKTTETWGGVSYIYLSELTFWGQNQGTID